MEKELLVNSDAEFLKIIDGCINDSNKCKTTLYKKYYYIILNVCKKYTNNIHEAEDLTHDIFLKVINKLNTFKGTTPGQFTSWVKMLSKNCTIDAIRRQRMKFSDVDEHELYGLNLDFVDIDSIDNTNQIMANDISLAISKLSPKFKLVFELFYIQNYSHDEIADELGINVGTSKSNLFKAKIKLCEMLKHYNNNFN